MNNNKFTSKQLVAWICIIVLVLLYILTLLAAIFDNSSSHTLFGISLFATIAVPLLAWVYIWLYGKMTGKKTIADFSAGTASENIAELEAQVIEKERSAD